MDDKIKNRFNNILQKVKHKPYQYGFFFALFTLIVIPGAIWISYFIGDCGFVLINTSLSVGDALGFYGTVLAFIGTVFLGALALWQNNQFRRENRRKEEFAIRPYLFSKLEYLHISFLAEHEIEFLQIDINKDLSISSVCESGILPPDVSKYVNVRNKNRDYVPLHTTDNSQSVMDRTQLIIQETECLLKLNTKYELVSYNIENHGTGSAVKINMLLNNQHIEPLFCLSHTEKKQFYFLINVDQVPKGDTVNFVLYISFYNVEDFGPYRQEEHFSIYRTDTGALSLILDQQITSPILDEEADK